MELLVEIGRRLGMGVTGRLTEAMRQDTQYH
jgi:hypothetical protein